jgi:hypothetical protein
MTAPTNDTGDAQSLVFEDFEKEDWATILQKIAQAGEALSALTLKPAYYTPHLDFSQKDWAEDHPNLQNVELTRALVDASLLVHPTLVQVHLEGCVFSKKAPVTLGMAPQRSAIRKLHLIDTGILPNALHFGPQCALEHFRCFIDDDSLDEPAETYRFDGAAQLHTIEIRAGNGWEVELLGSLPALKSVELDGGTYGDFEVKNNVVPDSSAYARDLNTDNAKREDDW